MIIETLLYPEEVIYRHNYRFIAHRRYNKHIVRAIYEYQDNLPILITVYFPSTKRYFKGGKKFEDKIF